MQKCSVTCFVLTRTIGEEHALDKGFLISLHNVAQILSFRTSSAERNALWLSVGQGWVAGRYRVLDKIVVLRSSNRAGSRKASWGRRAVLSLAVLQTKKITHTEKGDETRCSFEPTSQVLRGPIYLHRLWDELREAPEIYSADPCSRHSTGSIRMFAEQLTNLSSCCMNYGEIVGVVT